MIRQLLIAIFLLTAGLGFAQGQHVAVQNDSSGAMLTVDGQPIMINGMNWDYFPIGTNYNYSLWNQTDEFIKKALDDEMGLLKNMNVNAIRIYSGIPPKWIQYIYETYGIYTMLNHSFGRYGVTIDGAWMQHTDYGNPKVQVQLLQEVEQIAQKYNNTPGLLLYLLGNENNYGLFWDGAETEDIPVDQRKSTLRAEDMYALFNKAALAMKNIDNTHPIAICNGDLLFLDLVNQHCPDIDIYGTNMYRGLSFGDAFARVKSEYGKPILFTEFGSDAYNALERKEAQRDQAAFLVNNWKEIYQNAAGMGMVGNSLGGFTFQFSDGWWKYGQTKNLDVHDNNASWSNGGYLFDFKKGKNNMNEEWFGICAKGQTEVDGTYELYPRAAYYALQEAHSYNPFSETANLQSVDYHFSEIQLTNAELLARGDKAMASGKQSVIRLSNLQAKLETYNTGGHLITTPKQADPNSNQHPDQLGFDNMQSFFFGVTGQPTDNLKAEVNFNVLGNVAQNPIDQIFYENRGWPVEVEGTNGDVVTISDNERIKLYNAQVDWNTDYVDIKGFYRTGHFHWGYDGDFFNIYREANYGPNLDTYNGEIDGLEFNGKGDLDGLNAAFGRQLWWGSNPNFLVKYNNSIKGFEYSGLFRHDFSRRSTSGASQSSQFIPQPKTTTATIAVGRDFGNFGVQVGGLWGGQPLNGRSFQYVKGSNPSNYVVYNDEVDAEDNWGGKIKVTYDGGAFKWYAIGASAGLVANAGADQTVTYTGWKLKDNGSGNQNSFLTGFVYNVGDWQIAPNFLWQKPLVEAIPDNAGGPARLRNILDDPFSVRDNRETVAGELLVTYDPTPASWFYEWDNDRFEDAPFAANLGFVYRHLPTTMDAAIGFFGDARVPQAFSQSVPAHDLWELSSRMVSRFNSEAGLIANIYTGNGQANGSDDRLIHRTGFDIRGIYKKFKLQQLVKFNDWGPYDYHRDYNLTYPLQLTTDLSANIGKPDWFILPQTKIGVRGTWRSLNEYSPRYLPTYVPDGTYPPVPTLSPVGFDNGSEWEIRTYLHINIGK